MKDKVPTFQNMDQLHSKKPRSGVLTVPAPGSGWNSPEVHVTAKEPGDADRVQGSTGCYHSHAHRSEGD